MKATRGTSYRRIWRSTVIDWLCTPPTLQRQGEGRRGRATRAAASSLEISAQQVSWQARGASSAAAAALEGSPCRPRTCTAPGWRRPAHAGRAPPARSKGRSVQHALPQSSSARWSAARQRRTPFPGTNRCKQPPLTYSTSIHSPAPLSTPPQPPDPPNSPPGACSNPDLRRSGSGAHTGGAVRYHAVPCSATHLDGEVNVTGGVDDVDVQVLPPAKRGCRLDGDALLTLQVHAVHLGAHTILAAHLRGQPGRGRGWAGCCRRRRAAAGGGGSWDPPRGWRGCGRCRTGCALSAWSCQSQCAQKCRCCGHP